MRERLRARALTRSLAHHPSSVRLLPTPLLSHYVLNMYTSVYIKRYSRSRSLRAEIAEAALLCGK